MSLIENWSTCTTSIVYVLHRILQFHLQLLFFIHYTSGYVLFLSYICESNKYIQAQRLRNIITYIQRGILRNSSIIRCHKQHFLKLFYAWVIFLRVKTRDDSTALLKWSIYIFPTTYTVLHIGLKTYHNEQKKTKKNIYI